MSTSFLVENLLRALLVRCGLRLVVHPDCDPCAADADYRIMPAGVDEIIFQGTMDRCSDYVRGFMQGAGYARP